MVEVAPARPEPGVNQPSNQRRWFWVVAAWVAVAVAMVTLHLTTQAHTLTEHDSVNLARGLQHYDVVAHAPHPPGYPLVVAIAHLFAWTGGPVEAYVAVAVLFSVLTVVSTWGLARELFGPSAGLPATAACCAAPLFWYYADIVSVYLPEAALAALVALVAHRVARRADRWSPLLLAPILALAAGFRPTMLLLMLPTCLLGVAIGRPSPRRVLAGAVLALVVLAAWAVPMVALSGGLGAYRAATAGLWQISAARTSILSGAPAPAALGNALTAAAATVMTVLPAVVIALPAAVSSQAVQRLWARRRPALLLLASWLLPYLVLYGGVHFGKPGYVLAYLPAVAALAGGLAAEGRRSGRTLLAAGVAVTMVAGYLLLPSWPLPVQAASFWPTAATVRAQDAEARYLPAVSASCPADSCAIVSLPISLRYWCRDVASIASWYAPRARVIHPNQLTSQAAGSMTLVWMGDQPPPAVVALATFQGQAGPWLVYRSNPAVTASILRRGVPTTSCA